eukprot:SM000008S22311  [mRNA]  locus=s8:1022275:1022915:+ [translate_table: standard]
MAQALVQDLGEDAVSGGGGSGGAEELAAELEAKAGIVAEQRRGDTATAGGSGTGGTTGSGLEEIRESVHDWGASLGEGLREGLRQVTSSGSDGGGSSGAGAGGGDDVAAAVKEDYEDEAGNDMVAAADPAVHPAVARQRSWSDDIAADDRGSLSGEMGEPDEQ